MAIARQHIFLPHAAHRRALAGLLGGGLWDGPEVERFERAFAAYIGVPETVAVPSGRAGLHFLLDALALEPTTPGSAPSSEPAGPLEEAVS